MSKIAERIAKLPPNRQELFSRLLKQRQIDLSHAVIMPRVRNSNLAPLSFSQQRLWLFLQLDPDNISYNIPEAFRLKGQLQVTALVQSFAEIVRRHEALRTTFQVVSGQPMQVIGDPQQIALEVIDLRRLPRPQREQTAQRLTDEEAQRPFDLARGPLLRVRLLKLDDEEHILLVTLHHIVSDGWSAGILGDELTTLYQAFSLGQSSSLPELPIQYADFAMWQRDWLSGQVLEEQLGYWRKKLSGALPVLELPGDRLRPAIQSSRGASEAIDLPEELSRKLRSLSNDEGATLFMTLLAAFMLLIHRYTGQTDICVGVPIANRNRAETENLIGFFVNNLVLRSDLEGNPTFRSFLAQIEQETLNAYAHQDMPFEKLVEELQPERSLSYMPLFQLMFMVQNSPPGNSILPNLNPSEADIGITTTKYDLSLSITDVDNHLYAFVVYNSDLFDASTIQRLLKHYQILLESIVANPQQHIEELPVLMDEELLLFDEVNNTRTEYPEGMRIHELFEEQAARTPDAIAVVCDDRQLTYGELNEQANELAHCLRQRGVGPETIVGILMERSLEIVVGLLGVLKASGAYLPLDLNYPQQRLVLMLEEAQVSLILTHEHGQKILPEFHGELLCLDGDAVWSSSVSLSTEEAELRADSLAFVFYTSGSTGKPKGVMATQRSAVNYLTSIVRDYEVSTADTVLQTASLSFDASVRDIIGPLIAGAKLVLVPDNDVKDPFALRARIKDHDVTCILSITPTGLRSLTEAVAETGTKGESLRLILTSGESLSLSECARVRAVLGERISIVNQYGATECTMSSTRYRVPESQSSGMALAGKPIANSQVYILDPHFGQCPIGVPGEVHIGGVGVARGYLTSPALTALKYIPNPFTQHAGARLYRTGDVGRFLPGGDIELHGRVDRQVKVRGIRIEPGEIETVLHDHENVREAAVIVREDRPGNQRLVAYVVLRQPENHLRAFVKARVPGHMVPAAFVVLDKLPLTPNGKVDHAALPIPDPASFDSNNEFVAPQTHVELTLAQIWKEILGVTQVGIHDNFFDLGGHSLLATQVVSRIRKTLKADLPLRVIFDSPTIAGLAPQVESMSRTESDELEKLAELLARIDQLSTDETKVLLEGSS
ncbi:MAG TPA: amino acid adenylation domain-containing protein [Pyrinomonadaceae bacterium]|nr:amino acid adenylation domain-containing protein [Pyrinomonadaceae bacterium]